MLLKKIDFTAPSNKSKLDISLNTNNQTWEEYYASYAYVIYQTMLAGFEMSQPYNPHGKAILFLMRHALELQLKSELAKRGEIIPTTSNIPEIIVALGGINSLPEEIHRLVQIIDLDQNGYCYRYYFDSCKKSTYFKFGKVVETAEYFAIHEKMVNSNIFNSKPICPDLKIHEDWDLNFQVGYEFQYWHLRFQYDLIIEILLEGVLNGTVDLQQSYIPLLFLIRHALELSLKAFVSDLEQFTGTECVESLCSEYRLSVLYREFEAFAETLNLDKMDVEMQEELKILLCQFNLHRTNIEALDFYNENFRFPESYNTLHMVKFSEIPLAELIELYYHSNKILSFSIDVLVNEGILTSKSL
ncbi:hypothetical protein [[Flexibacter] sp. ATCC 35208]|uniref:hypothetical protein n=1 Tax=[Flexibacter] sp. ATCC 35208 TaxID=1936242 RepID=UPI0009C58562|nr:hypothetical protein [[Flexibacter] sp. ATCC 35208]OMP75131.1 hypothetical protein BW716_31710 [[Flexibacter] sp. ATCC 35208]